MNNLEQERAAHALTQCHRKTFDHTDVAGFPALIMQNGLLASFAFATEGKESRKGMKAACDATADYLITVRKIIMPPADKKTAKDLISALASTNSATLIHATSETLAYFSYLKRFAEKKATPNQNTP